MSAPPRRVIFRKSAPPHFIFKFDLGKEYQDEYYELLLCIPSSVPPPWANCNHWFKVVPRRSVVEGVALVEYDGYSVVGNHEYTPRPLPPPPVIQVANRPIKHIVEEIKWHANNDAVRFDQENAAHDARARFRRDHYTEYCSDTEDMPVEPVEPVAVKRVRTPAKRALVLPDSPPAKRSRCNVM